MTRRGFFGRVAGIIGSVLAGRWSAGKQRPRPGLVPVILEHSDGGGSLVFVTHAARRRLIADCLPEHRWVQPDGTVRLFFPS